MNTASLVLVLLSHSGHWLAGTDANIALQWAANVAMPDAVVNWNLKYGTVTVASGQSDLAGRNGSTSVTIKVPDVRSRLTLQWNYRIVKRNGGDELTRGDATITAYPAKLVDDYRSRYKNRPVALLSNGGSLPKALAAAKISALNIVDTTNLAIDPPAVLIVGPDAIGPSRFDAPPLAALAAAGTQVLVFRQTRCQRLDSYELADRRADDQTTWIATHPLLDGLDAATLDGWLRESSAPAKVLRLPIHDSARAIGYFNREFPGDSPAPLDAIVVTRSIGMGRLLFVQLPADDFSTDPRALTLLNNALAYLLNPPEPTPATYHRTTTRPATVVLERRIAVGG